MESQAGTRLKGRPGPVAGEWRRKLVPAHGADVAAQIFESALPCHGMLDNRVEIVELGRPTKLRADARRIRDDHCRVAGTARRQLDLEVAAAHAPDRVDHLEDGIAVAIAAVERGIATAAA